VKTGERSKARSTRVVWFFSMNVGQHQHDAHARSMPAGAATVMDVPHGHWKIITFVAALRIDGMTAPTVVDGPIKR